MTSFLHQQRLDAVQQIVRACGAATVLDLGCGDGDLLLRLAAEPQITRLIGIDLDSAALERLGRRLRTSAAGRTSTIELLCDSISNIGPALAGFDCAVLLETIEHIEPDRLSAMEAAVFGRARPRTVVVTTPNAEFNPLLGVPAHRFRHPDHRFEWTRRRFRRWAEGLAARSGYRVSCEDIAGQHAELGGASQMAVFEDQNTATAQAA